MLYLAQVQTEQFLDKAGLRLLAFEQSDATWMLLTEEEAIPSVEANPFGEGQLVLVELTENRQVANISDAKDWVLQLIKQYLFSGITPEFFQEEIERAEQWRQSLTLQSQEVATGRLQVQARQAQLEIIETNLKNEKVELEEEKQDLEKLRKELEEEKQDLEKLRKELESRQQSLDETSNPEDSAGESD